MMKRKQLSATISATLALCALTLFVGQSGCEPRALKQACRDHSDCTDGRLCASVSGGPATCVTLVSDAAVDGIDLLPPVNCGQAWAPATLTDPTEVPPLLVGKWRRCGGDEQVSLASPFEFAADGTWYLLATLADGSTARLTGWGQTGTWEVKSLAAGTGGVLNAIVLYFNNTPGSSFTTDLLFMREPRVMQFGGGLFSPLP